MRQPRAIALHLGAWAQDELAAQQLLLERLAEQEAAVTARDLAGVENCGEQLAQLSRKGAKRARRRGVLLGELAQAWQVPAGALTLGSVVERLGPDGAQLAELRVQLREGAAQVLRATRRTGHLVNAFRRLSKDVIELLLTDEDGSPLHNGGALVDAEA
jgi:hypothetical protein